MPKHSVNILCMVWCMPALSPPISMGCTAVGLLASTSLILCAPPLPGRCSWCGNYSACATQDARRPAIREGVSCWNLQQKLRLQAGDQLGSFQGHVRTLPARMQLLGATESLSRLVLFRIRSIEPCKVQRGAPTAADVLHIGHRPYPPRPSPQHRAVLYVHCRPSMACDLDQSCHNINVKDLILAAPLKVSHMLDFDMRRQNNPDLLAQQSGVARSGKGVRVEGRSRTGVFGKGRGPGRL